MTLRIPAKVLIHMWSYNFYDMTLSTLSRKQRRHMIKRNISITFWIAIAFYIYLLYTTSEFQTPTTFLFVKENIKCGYSFS